MLILLKFLLLLTHVFASNTSPDNLSSEEAAPKALSIPLNDPLLMLIQNTLLSERIYNDTEDEIIFNEFEEDLDNFFGLQNISKDRKWLRFLGLEEVDDATWKTSIKATPNSTLTKILMRDAVWSYIFPWNRMYALSPDIFAWGIEEFKALRNNLSYTQAYRVLSCLFQMESKMEKYINTLSSDFLNIAHKYRLMIKPTGYQSDWNYSEYMYVIQRITEYFSDFEKKLLICFALQLYFWMKPQCSNVLRKTPLEWRCAHFHGILSEMVFMYEKSNEFLSDVERFEARCFRGRAKMMFQIISFKGLPSITHLFEYQQVTYSPFFKFLIYWFEWPRNQSISYYFQPHFWPIHQIPDSPKLKLECIPEDISQIIPHLPPTFFAKNKLKSMHPANINALTIKQIENYNIIALPFLDWNLLNCSTRQHLLNNAALIQKMIEDLNSANFPLIPPNVLVSNIGLPEVFRLHSDYSLLSPEQQNSVKGFIFKHSSLLKILQIEKTKYQSKDWRSTAQTIKIIFVTSPLPEVNGLDWNDPKLPTQYEEFGIENLYGFEELFTGIPRGVWLAFFGFIQVSDEVWASLWRREQIDLFGLLDIAIDPVFSLIFPWSRLYNKGTIKLFYRALMFMSKLYCTNASLKNGIYSWRLYYAVRSLLNTQSNSLPIIHNPSVYINESLFKMFNLFNIMEEYLSLSGYRRKAPLATIYYLCRNGISFLFDAAITVEKAFTSLSLSNDSCRSLLKRTTEGSIIPKCEDKDYIHIILEHLFSFVMDEYEILEFWIDENILDRYQKFACDYMGIYYLFDKLFINLHPHMRIFLVGNSPLISYDRLENINDETFLSELGEDFFAVNKYNSLPSSILSKVTPAQLWKFDRCSLGKQCWLLFNEESLRILFYEHSLLVEILEKGCELDVNNYLLIPMEIFKSTIEGFSVSRVLELIGGESYIPDDYEKVMADHLLSCKNVNLEPFLKSVEVSFLFNLLIKVEDVQFFAISNRAISQDYMQLLYNAYKSSGNPNISLYIKQQALDNVDALLHFFIQPWETQMFDTKDCSRISPTDLSLIIKFVRNTDDRIHFRNLFKNLYLHRHVFEGELLTIALDYVIARLFHSEPFTLESCFWNKLPLELFKKYVKVSSTIIYRNMRTFMPYQLEYLFEKMKKKTNFLIDVFEDAFEKKEVLLLPPEFWNTESLIENILEKLWHRRPFIDTIPTISILAANFPNLGEEQRIKMLELASTDSSFLWGMLSSPNKIQFPENFWKTLPDIYFSSFIRAYYIHLDRIEYLSDNFPFIYLRRNLPYYMQFMTKYQYEQVDGLLYHEWFKGWNIILKRK